MGGYRDSSDEDRRRKKKKKKRSHSRSREGSIDSSVSSKKSSKHKTKKKKHRSRSRSAERRYNRKRSRSLSKERSYNRSRSRSRDRGRKKYDHRSRSRSWDRENRRYSRSRSRDRRSRSRDRRSRSLDRRRDRRSRSSSRDSRLDNLKREKDDPCAHVPGFLDMMPAEQAKVRMQLALRAAAAADEKLKEQGVLLHPKSAMSAGELKKFNESVENIEAESFAPSVFLSTRENPLTTAGDDGSGRTQLEKTHDDAIFGLGSGKLDIKLDASERTKVVYSGAASLAHPNLHKTPEEKMGRWLEKLTAMRKRKLEGEAMT